MTSSSFKRLLLALSFTLLSTKGWAYLSLLSTGDIVPQDHVQVLGYLEGILDEDYEGLTANGRATYGINEELQIDAELGFGKIDVTLGAFAKWVPIPDVDDQPAIGVRGGVSYLKYNDFSQTSIVAMPFLSKAFQTNIGRVSPYAGIPLGVNSHDSDSDFFTRLAIGSELSQTESENMRFIGEIDFELSKSFSSITVGAAYDF